MEGSKKEEDKKIRKLSDLDSALVNKIKEKYQIIKKKSLLGGMHLDRELELILINYSNNICDLCRLTCY